MERTWLSVLLSNDERKRSLFLTILAEAGVLSFVTSIGLMLVLGESEYLGSVQKVSIIVFMSYGLLRYTLSGMEHHDVYTKSQLNKKATFFAVQALVTSVLFYLATVFLSSSPHEEHLIVYSLLLGIGVFLAQWVSLYFSYRKNKDL
ncbi:hypothetical protein N781_02835 [Pontibacillus halophilus JSM 076056 = DSM 19796]|uniref:Uncharacterized protein n=1 Tax=Pontibacillus halophilus JSM 076056 = DSM 19796 TaxID=1385510 RepID=A0A0A5GLH9_9BACI|nr:hypothetical protein [Pontibacillus halophilus]KGX92068.1 hypothetical protein N781_02835 [Pontibacillus halophilus JSM 076056 = DSM 19796]